MTSTPDLYDANVISDGLTIDTTGGPVDMVAVLGRLNGTKGLRLTRAEVDVVDAIRHRYRELRPAAGRQMLGRDEAYRRLARVLLDAA
jgi:hypothetical protein